MAALVSDIASMAADALTEGRATAEALMVDACTISRGPFSPGTFDPVTGVWTDPASTVIYAGVCQVQVSDGLTAREVEVAQTEITAMRLTVKVPIAAVGVLVDDEVTVTAAVHDPDLVAKSFRVVATHTKSFATARRLQVEEIA